MPVDFTLRSCFLKVPNELLKSFFERRGELLHFAWDAFALGDTDPAHEEWLKLPVERRDDGERELRGVFEFATPDAVARLVEAGSRRGIDLREPLARRKGLWHQVLWAYLEHREVFEAARALQRIDVLHGRYWMQRLHLPCKTPDTSQRVCDELSAAVSAYYLAREGCGAFCEFHYVPRDTSKHCYVGYPEDHPETDLGYGAGGRLELRGRKGVFRVAFVYDAAEGSLCVNARGGRVVQEELQRIFARVALGEELAPESSPPQIYRVHLFKRRDFAIPLEPADGLELARVKALRLNLLGRSRMLFDARGLALGLNVYDDVEDALRGLRVPDANVEVDHATLQFVFKEMQPRVLPVRLSAHGCDLRDGPAHAVVRRCLRRAGLACA